MTLLRRRHHFEEAPAATTGRIVHKLAEGSKLLAAGGDPWWFLQPGVLGLEVLLASLAFMSPYCASQQLLADSATP